MHIIFFVEELSAEEALKNLVPQLLPPEATFQFITFQGKPDLLSHLPSRLLGYASWMPYDWRIVVLVDEDRQDCLALKQILETAAFRAGLSTKSQIAGPSFQVLNRIAVEELEAWFLGDVGALHQVYPRLPFSLAQRERFRDPDKVVGGTREALENVLQSYGYHLAGYPKVDAARQISLYMDPNRNRSHSFQVFIKGLQAL